MTPTSARFVPAIAYCVAPGETLCVHCRRRLGWYARVNAVRYVPNGGHAHPLCDRERYQDRGVR
jgi:hypothetical protein